MTGHDWVVNRWGNTCYGKQKDNDFSDTKGVTIYNGEVVISHWNANGDATEPKIYCNACEFAVYE